MYQLAKSDFGFNDCHQHSPSTRHTLYALASVQAGISERRAALIPAWRNLASCFRGRQAYAQARARQRADWFMLRRLELRLGLPPHSLPVADGRAGACDFLLLLTELVIQNRPEIVVEFGSGVSTLVLARALQMNGTGRLISFEHKEGFAHLARARLKERALSAEVRSVPLVSAGPWGFAGKWYGVDELPQNIDLAVVDGPPAYFAPETRGGAGPAVIPNLAPDGLIVLDDAKRAGEREITRRWRNDYPDFDFVDIDTHKGTLLGQRTGEKLATAGCLSSKRWRTSSFV